MHYSPNCARLWDTSNFNTDDALIFLHARVFRRDIIMTKQKRRHYITEHIWRAIRAILLIIAVLIWLFQDGWSNSDWLVLLFCFIAHLTEQFHGLICNTIEKILNWKCDFNNWE